MIQTSHIRIGPFDYELLFVERLQDEDGEACDGLQRYNATTIEIESTLSPESQLAAIWHEAIHAILDNAGIRPKLQKENVIDAISHGILQIIRDNQWILAHNPREGG